LNPNIHLKNHHHAGGILLVMMILIQVLDIHVVVVVYAGNALGINVVDHLHICPVIHVT
jgi:hypothetical protein